MLIHTHFVDSQIYSIHYVTLSSASTASSVHICQMDGIRLWSQMFWPRFVKLVCSAIRRRSGLRKQRRGTISGAKFRDKVRADFLLAMVMVMEMSQLPFPVAMVVDEPKRLKCSRPTSRCPDSEPSFDWVTMDFLYYFTIFHYKTIIHISSICIYQMVRTHLCKLRWILWADMYSNCCEKVRWMII